VCFLYACYCLSQLAWIHEMLHRHGPRAVLSLDLVARWCRYHCDSGRHHHSLSRFQRSSLCDVSAARSSLLPDPADGACRPAWWILETAWFRRLGSSTGTHWSPVHAVASTPHKPRSKCFNIDVRERLFSRWGGSWYNLIP